MQGNLHPLIVHFPIVLLTVYPFLVAFSLWRRKNKELDIIAFVFLLVGTAGLWFAIESGEALDDSIKILSPQVYQVLERHEEYAEITRNIALLAIVVYALFSFIGAWKKKYLPFAGYVYLVLGIVITGGALLTASEGGKLTHFYRVGAVHCQEIAHPFGDIAKNLLPLNEKREKWEKKYFSSSQREKRKLLESLCGGIGKEFY